MWRGSCQYEVNGRAQAGCTWWNISSVKIISLVQRRVPRLTYTWKSLFEDHRWFKLSCRISHSVFRNVCCSKVWSFVGWKSSCRTWKLRLCWGHTVFKSMVRFSVLGMGLGLGLGWVFPPCGDASVGRCLGRTPAWEDRPWMVGDNPSLKMPPCGDASVGRCLRGEMPPWWRWLSCLRRKMTIPGRWFPS